MLLKALLEPVIAEGFPIHILVLQIIIWVNIIPSVRSKLAHQPV